MRLDRMIGILALLLQKERITAPELAERFEVSRRTISRDVAALCAAGIPLVTTQGPRGGISIMEGYRIDRTLLTSADMQAILTGLRSLDSVSGTRRYTQLMEKLQPGASSLLTGDSHILIDLSSWYRDSLPLKIETIHSVIDAGKMLHFTYYGPGGESERTAEPYDLIFQWSSWYLWAYCRDRADFRLFKLNRMTELQAGERFLRRPAPLPDLTPERIFPEGYLVKARVEPAYKWRLVEEYGADSFSVLPDGALLFTCSFTGRESLIQWIVSFGGGAELLEPSQLREEVAEFAERIWKKHKNETIPKIRRGEWERHYRGAGSEENNDGI